MKRMFKIFAFIISGLMIILISVLAYISLVLPRVDAAPDFTVEINEEQVARGKYLANHVMQCVDCHSVRDFSLYSGPPTPGTELAGGERFDHSMGLPGVFYSPNITPAGIGDWTDGEIFRLITTGVKKDGNPIFPIMPYEHYSKMDEEDIKAVIAYLRSVEPIETNHPKSKPDFPVNLIMRTFPRNVAFEKKPEFSDQIEYGRYMVNASACAECHTKFENGKFTGEFLAGGREFAFPDGSVLRSVNLTPDETGIRNWTKEMFVQRFKSYADPGYVNPIIQPGEFQTIMPWMMYAGLTEEDLSAMYDYLMTLQPINNPIERFSVASK